MISLSKEKRSLFGGTLRCAGLAAATVTSPLLADFQPVQGPGTANYTFNYTIDAASDTPVIFDYDLNTVGGFPVATNNVTNYVKLISYANSVAMGAGVAAYGGGGYSYAGAVVWQYFTVDNTKSGTMTWNLTDGSQYAQVYIYQFGVGALLNEVAGSVGSQDFILQAGETYAVIVRASTSSFSGSEFVYGVFTWDVPSPGAFALLGIAGMIGKRRRRT